MPLINCEISLILTWSNRCLIIDSPIVGQELTFTITDMKLYVSVVTLSAQDDTTLLEQENLGFKTTISLNKYESKVILEQQNWDLIS